MRERRLGRLGRGLIVTFFLIQSLGILWIYLVLSIAFELSTFDGPPAAGHTMLFLGIAALVAFLALVAAAVEASGLLERSRTATRLAVIMPALAMNVFGLVESTRWFVDFATSEGPSDVSAVRSRPRLAVLLDA